MTSDFLNADWTGTTHGASSGPAPAKNRWVFTGIAMLWAATPSGTTNSTVSLEDTLLGVHAPGQTDQGFIARTPGSTTATAADLARLRQRTGLTWSQLAKVFRVHRRSLHNWILGHAMTPKNAEVLRAALRATQPLEQRLASQSKSILQSADSNGISILDHLSAGDFARARELIEDVTSAPARRYKRPPKLSSAERKRRTGSSIRERFGSSQEAGEV